MAVQISDSLKEEYCRKGNCSAKVMQYRDGSLPEDFTCPRLFARNRAQVLCSLPTIEGAARKIPICKIYETFKTGNETSGRFNSRPSPFSKYGYLSILEPSGIDLL